MYWSGILALAGWASVTIAQGNLGGDQSASCPASQNQVYVGCYENSNTNFPFRLATDPSDPKGYPGFTNYNQLTADLCKTVCRGHGFEYSGTTFSEACYCSTRLPYPQNPPSGSTANGPGALPGTGTAVADSRCNTPCTGNSAQTCGGYGTTAIYRDPSFSSDSTLPTRGDPSNYLYFGCYSNAGAGPQFIDIKTPNTTSCQQYCGLLGYAYSLRGDSDVSSSNNCGCGSEIQAGLQIDETRCNRVCVTGANSAAYVF